MAHDRTPGLWPRIAMLSVAMVAVTTVVRPVYAQQRAHVSIGDLDLAYDTTTWRVVTAGQHFVATCVAKDCQGVEVVGDASTQGSCDSFVAEHAGRSRLTATALRGIVMVYAEIDLGCRNLVPPRVSACARRELKTYRFESAPHTCRGGPRTRSTDTVIELLKGLTGS